MGRLKNALRGHFVQEYTGAETEPGTEWLELAKYIATISDETEEEIESEAFYDGDGTLEDDVTSVAGAYGFEGYYDAEDPAQALIAGKKYKVGKERKVWHKVVSADGANEWVAKATVSDIVAGAGEASGYEEFSCTIKFDTLPEETATTPEG